MRKTIAVLAVLAVAVVAVFAVPAMAATRTIKVGDFFFVRNGHAPTVTVSRGTRVVWAFKGRVSHNVAVRRGPVKFRSRTMARGNFAETLRRAGTYKIICTIHPGMEMTLRVR